MDWQIVVSRQIVVDWQIVMKSPCPAPGATATMAP